MGGMDGEGTRRENWATGAFQGQVETTYNGSTQEYTRVNKYKIPSNRGYISQTGYLL